MTRYKDTQLGKQTSYADQYDPNLLCPIPRNQARPAESFSKTCLLRVLIYGQPMNCHG